LGWGGGGWKKDCHCSLLIRPGTAQVLVGGGEIGKRTEKGDEKFKERAIGGQGKKRRFRLGGKNVSK